MTIEKAVTPFVVICFLNLCVHDVCVCVQYVCAHVCDQGSSSGIGLHFYLNQGLLFVAVCARLAER